MMTDQERERQAALDAFSKQRDAAISEAWVRSMQGTFTEIGVALNRTMEAMRPFFNAYAKAAESVNRSLFRMLFPDAAKRLMLREARRRARLSTQRRRARQ